MSPDIEIGNDVVPFENKQFAKSNYLISAKYKSTLMENKLLAIGLMNVQNDNGRLVSKLPASYLRSLLCKGKKNGSFYDQLFNTALRMTDRKVVMQDEEGFDIFHLTPRARYSKKESIFYIYWEDSLRDYIHDIKKNFTILNLSVLVSFDSVFSYRLYELLKSKAYYPKGEYRDDYVFHYKLGLAELKLDLGAVDSSSDKVQKILIPAGRQKSTPDYERAVEIAEEKKFNDWYNFRRSVLDVAVKEINKKTDLYIEYEPEKSGRGGKVVAVNFVIYDMEKRKKQVEKDNKKEQKKLSENDKIEFIYEIMDIFSIKLKPKDLRMIAEAAEYDKEKIEKANQVFESYHGEIENVVGFIISAIKDGYEASEKKKKKNSFNNFHQREYDYDQLELQILRNDMGIKEEE